MSCECEFYFEPKITDDHTDYALYSSEGEERLNGTEAIFEERVADSFLKLIKHIKPPNPKQDEYKKAIPRYIIGKLFKTGFVCLRLSYTRVDGIYLYRDGRKC